MEYYVSDQPNKNGVPCKLDVCADVIKAQNRFKALFSSDWSFYILFKLSYGRSQSYTCINRKTCQSNHKDIRLIGWLRKKVGKDVDSISPINN